MSDKAKKMLEQLAALVERAEAEGKDWSISHGLHEECQGGIAKREALEERATETVTLRFLA